MAHGQVKCCGTPLYLKKYFGKLKRNQSKFFVSKQLLLIMGSFTGAGYILKLTIKKGSESGSILQIVKNHIPDGYLMKEETSGHDSVELSVSIPCDENTGPKLAPLFTSLDESKDNLGIQTIGLSLSSIEDVFLAYVNFVALNFHTNLHSFHILLVILLNV